ncbi:5-carboxymethyl-2-hydroxymuconate Delta-isomerase [Alginatibacterium sediminis]|uniref:5-carboxymethyl-2-hydroxymuconate Delta-isomerase n=1 Tax=Alginatibacterium sediminis TaxID=2164068 RepID=A0A420EJQ0_9ALTE|nr:5-carboxymethyl-2-hydroxymuconate Delta-isomerase [Alginatibacterium sediminis]RKF20880.1 5-carboxymethyl-2-hydroxymuconate Delta-isomerase [Alginatibacterium sediminis]
MPHCIIEYDQSLDTSIDIENVVQGVQQCALESGLFEPSAIKTRAIACSHCASGQGDSQMLHVRIHLFAGRSASQKLALSESMLAALDAMIPQVPSLSVELVDMDSESYQKRILV